MSTASTASRRVGFLDGQLLIAADLRDDVAHESAMRGLHVRGVHQTWGVALGLDVYPSSAGDKLLVGPGAAYDCYGRLILSPSSVSMELPRVPAAGWHDLVIRYRDPRELASCPSGENPIEEPTWRWALVATLTAEGQRAEVSSPVRLGEEIPLARVQVAAGKLVRNPDLTVRRTAQGLVRPHIGAGRQAKGSTTIEGSLWAWSVSVDTSAAGFTRSPLYFASLADHPLGESSGFVDLLPKEPGQLLREVVGPFVSIRQTTRTGFILDVRSVWSPGASPIGLRLAGAQTLALALPVAVNWVGIESAGGCQPEIDLTSVRSLSGGLLGDLVLQFSNLIAGGLVTLSLTEA